MRFSKNEHVFHESGGVCEILDILTAPLEGMPKDRVYYVMRSLHDANGVIYVPVDSDAIFVRPLLTKALAERLLCEFDRIEPIDEPNPKLLRAKYVEAMQTYLPSEWIRVIKTANVRMQLLSMRSQKMSETERSYYELAKRNLCAEFSIVLEMQSHEVEQLFAEKTTVS